MVHFNAISAYKSGAGALSFPARVVGILPSPSFPLTTWLTFALFDGLHETTLEWLYQTATTYPLNRAFNGLTADYTMFVSVQSAGRRVTRAYMATVSENAPGADATQHVALQQRLRAIRAYAANLRR